jgi:hypothetical protein
MAEIEHFLKQDFRSASFVRHYKDQEEDEREEFMKDFWSMTWGNVHPEADLTLFKERFRQVCQWIALYDEELSDESGLAEENERCRRALRSSHIVVGGGVALSSLVPYSLKCERASGPSHVDDGGGDALQGSSFSELDKSSPVQSERFRGGVDQSQC